MNAYHPERLSSCKLSLHIAAISIQQSNKQQPATEQPANTTEDLMIDSGAATHVCPPWFAPTYKTHELHPEQGPRLTTATEEDITVYGYKWVYMKNSKQQPIVIPFYVCDVSQPILSVTRLASQGFNTQLSDHPTITNTNGFRSNTEATTRTVFSYSQHQPNAKQHEARHM